MIVPPSRAPRPRILAALLVATALTLGLGIAAPASAAQSTPSPTPTPTVGPPAGTTAFTVAPIRSGIMRAGDGLTVSVGIENATDAATPPVTVTLSLGRTALGSRAALTSWLAGAVDGVAVDVVGSTLLESVAPGDQDFAGIMVPPDAPALAGIGPGAYPLVASYDGPAGAVQSTSVVVVPRDSSGAGIGIMVPITAGVRSEALLTAAELTALTQDGGALADQLDAVEGTQAILAIDPAIPAAIRVLGAAAPPTATAWLDRLEAIPNSRIALQFGDADPAIQVDAGSRPRAPTSLGAFLRPIDFPADATGGASPSPATTPTPTPTPPVDPLAPMLPTLTELLDVGATRSAVFWPSADAVTPSAVVGLGAITVDDDPSLTVLPSTAAVSGASGATVAARATVGDAGVLVYDADISRELSAAAADDEGPLRAASLSAASGYLSFASSEVGDASVLAVLDRSLAGSNVSIRAAIEAATEYPDLSAQTLAGVTAGPPRAERLVETVSPADRVAAASTLFAEEVELGRFATILDDPALLTGPERAEILQLLAVGWAERPEDWATAVFAHHEATAATFGSVRLLPTSTINLYGSGAALRFTVRNDLPYPVNLVLYATPDDLRLDVQRANPVVATAASNTRVEVPVQARIGNGEVVLTLQLRSRASVAIGQPEAVEVNVRAEWETFGIIALSVVVGGLVVLGIVRTVRRARSRKTTATDASPSTASSDGPDT